MTTVNDFDTELPLPLQYTDSERAEDDAELGVGGAFAVTLPVPPELRTAPAPEKKGPGPAANPNSGRQKRLAAAAAKRAAAEARNARPAAGPRKRAVPNKPAEAPPLNAEYVAGASTMLGWIVRPLAMGAMALNTAAIAAPKMAPAKRQMLAQQSAALSMDVITITMHGDALVDGAAHAAQSGSAPWLAAALVKAAKVGPYVAVLEALSTIGLQMLVNHGVMPANNTLGTVDPYELAKRAGVADMFGPPAEDETVSPLA